MSCCYHEADRKRNAARSESRGAAVIQWAIPVIGLALVPKCPACVAAYVLIFTGVGLSLPAAAAVRWILIAFGAVALVILVVRHTRRMRASAWRRSIMHH
jgi:hypothetical protein